MHLLRRLITEAHRRSVWQVLSVYVVGCGAYRRFADLWADADPEFQPRVRHARERIAALGG